MNSRNQKLTLDRLESLFDSYGGDLSRWPERLADEAHTMIGSSSEARRLHAEARALDRLLAKASAPDPAQLDRLAERIMAVAAHEGVAKPANVGSEHDAGAGARIIPMPVGRRSGAHHKPTDQQAAPVSSAERVSRGRWFGGDSWPAAAALAASLAFGVAIGFSDIAPNATYNVASFVQPAPSDADAALSDLQLEMWNGLDEEQI
jgi:hypothetical protein